MRVIVVLVLLCLLNLGAGRRVKRESGPSVKDEDGPLQDEFDEEEDDLIDEPDPFDPAVIESKCQGKPTAKDKAACVCESAEGADLSAGEVKSRCKQLRFSVLKIKALPYSCKYPPLVPSGCKAWHPRTGAVEPKNPSPEMKKEDEKKNDDPANDPVEDELELEDEMEEETEFFCKEKCKFLKKCYHAPALGDDEPADQTKDMDKECEDKCDQVPQTTDCKKKGGGGGGGGGGGPAPDQRKNDDVKDNLDDDLNDLDEEFEDPEEDLGDGDNDQKEEEKPTEKPTEKPILTCSSFIKAARPGKLATKAQVERWCGGTYGVGCGKKMKMRTWAICGLADGAVKGPGYKGAITSEKGPFDCYINCKGEAEKVGGVVEDCISEWGGWGRCSKNCGGGWQRRQLNIKKYPSGGGAQCPTPHSRQCHTHKCPDCFPADASVETSAGSKLMSDLRVGDRVRSVDGAGNLVFDEVYFFGHADNSKSTEYVNLELSETTASLQLSRGHFIPMCPQHGERCEWADHIHAYGQDVRPGDHVWVVTAAGSKLHRVLATSTVEKNGLYNPYTLSGKIVVNGVVASAHSNWVLDDWTPSSMSQYLPAIYQMMFLPGRVLYQLAGASAADYLDVNNPQLTGTHGYGPEFLVVCLLSGLTAGLIAMRKAHLK